MLILPLHQPLTRANFPFATAALLLVNIAVFLVLQSGDGAAWERADQHYRERGLAAIEAPLYERHRRERGADPAIDDAAAELPAEAQEEFRQQAMQLDRGFRARLQAGELFASAAEHRAWLAAATGYQRLRERIVTDRWAFDAEQPQASRLVSSMFLHGGIEHLLGNMLFLAALGLLVEGPLGAGWFTALYLAAGAGAGLTWLGWHGEGPGTVIGASGAIAGLMGAFCVLWGRRRVRFFYWFFVLFDYVRAPALLLLPLWLGWELLQLLAVDDSQVAYSAHAGGIVAGALLGFGLTALGRVRTAYFAEAEQPAQDGIALQQALQHLGRMQPAEAEALLLPLAQREPQRFDLALALYRCARYAGRTGDALQRAAALLSLPSTSAAEAREQAALLQDLGALAARLPIEPRAALAMRLAALGDGERALALLAAIDAEGAGPEQMPQRWLVLALRLREAGCAAPARQALQRLASGYPDTVEGGKARFLLSEPA